MSKISLQEIQAARINTAKRCIAQLQITKPLKVGLFTLNNETDVIIDGDIRDRAIWAADLFVAGPFVGKHIENGNKIWRDSLLVIASKQYENGKIPACISLDLNYRFLSPYFDTYGMWWIISADEYIQKTGDEKFRKYFTRIFKSVLEYCISRINFDYLYQTGVINFYSNWTVFRPRINALTNALFFKLILLADKYKLPIHINKEKFKKRFYNKFWDDKEKMFKDRKTKNISFLDANSLAILFDLVKGNDLADLLTSLEKFETSFGPRSYQGNPASISSYHKNLISPFMSYLYSLALVRAGLFQKAEKITERTLSSGLKVSSQYKYHTMPEYWDVNGNLGSVPAIGITSKWGRSLCHAWSLFGGFKI